jgi:hypothetical protein
MSLEQDIIDVFGTAPSYGYAMYTKEGDLAVHNVVETARFAKLNWAETYNLLCELAQDQRFAEATDTAVRETVYDALRFYNTGENFYI